MALTRGVTAPDALPERTHATPALHERSCIRRHATVRQRLVGAIYFEECPIRNRPWLRLPPGPRTSTSTA